MPAPTCISLNPSNIINTNISTTLDNTQPVQTVTTTATSNDDQIAKEKNLEEDEENDVSNEKNSNSNNQMQINDKDDTVVSDKLTTTTNQTNLISTQQQQSTSSSTLQNDPLIHAYITFLSVLSTRLSPLINVLRISYPPLMKQQDNQNDQPSNLQFITEPLGSLRLNLIKFFSKLLYTLSNDCA
ncbi:unnamed protein product, partial [Didymodactylos carnosus]